MSNMFLNIVSTFKGDGIKRATSELGAFGRQAGTLGSTLGKVGAALAGFGIAAKAVQFTSESIDSARDLERNMYSLNTIFGGMAPTMEKFVENAHQIGLSQKDAAKASTFLGSVLKQSGFSMSDTTKETQKLVSLGVDLATTYGYDVQEALLGMTALFRGEYDPIEKFGVAMKQSEINAELAARQQNNLTGAARRNAEQLIRMELLYERAADATGAFTGQSGNLFVEQMKLQAQFENMQASIGTQLLPVMVNLTTALLPLIDFIGPKLAEAVNDSIPVLQGFIAEIKNITDATTFTGGTVKVLLDVFGAFFSFIAQNFGVLLAFTALIGGVTTALNLYSIAATFAAANPIATAILILGSAFIVGANAAGNLTTELEANQRAMESLNPELQATAYEAEYVGGKFGYLAGSFSNAGKEARELRDELLLLETSTSLVISDGGKGLRHALREEVRDRNKAVAEQEKKMDGAKAAATEVVTPTGPTGIQAWLSKAQEEANEAQRRLQLIGAGLSAAVADSILASTDPVTAVADALYLISIGQISALTDAFNKSAAGQALVAEQAAKAAQEAADTAEKLRQQEQEILDKRKAAFESFSDSVKGIFGGIKESIMSAFTLPDLGNSVNSITRNIKKLIERTKAFAANITSLSDQGLGNELLQQIIAAGPMAGGRLAQALAGAGGGTISELNQAYGEFGSIASDIAGVGTRSAFGNAQVVNTYNIEVNGGVGSGPTIGKAIVDAIKSYERTSGAVWQGAA
jgi:hypothetical protein